MVGERRGAGAAREPERRIRRVRVPEGEGRVVVVLAPVGVDDVLGRGAVPDVLREEEVAPRREDGRPQRDDEERQPEAAREPPHPERQEEEARLEERRRDAEEAERRVAPLPVLRVLDAHAKAHGADEHDRVDDEEALVDVDEQRVRLPRVVPLPLAVRREADRAVEAREVEAAVVLERRALDVVDRLVLVGPPLRQVQELGLRLFARLVDEGPHVPAVGRRVGQHGDDAEEQRDGLAVGVRLLGEDLEVADGVALLLAPPVERHEERAPEREDLPERRARRRKRRQQHDRGHRAQVEGGDELRLERVLRQVAEPFRDLITQILVVRAHDRRLALEVADLKFPQRLLRALLHEDVVVVVHDRAVAARAGDDEAAAGMPRVEVGQIEDLVVHDAPKVVGAVVFLHLLDVVGRHVRRSTHGGARRDGARHDERGGRGQMAWTRLNKGCRLAGCAGDGRA